VAFSIPELQDGEHSLRFRAWDVMNNSTTKALDFKVAHGTRPAITSLTASVSPARSYTTFILAHNRPMSGISVTITVRDMTGRTVWKMHEQSNTSDAYYRADWDLTDTNGRRVEPGIYLFSAEIASTESKQSTKTEKLVVLAQ
jgi:flagellar hook assembly protein FlgD